jgi:hypothetical protein
MKEVHIEHRKVLRQIHQIGHKLVTNIYFTLIYIYIYQGIENLVTNICSPYIMILRFKVLR